MKENIIKKTNKITELLLQREEDFESIILYKKEIYRLYENVNKVTTKMQFLCGIPKTQKYGSKKYGSKKYGSRKYGSKNYINKIINVMSGVHPMTADEIVKALCFKGFNNIKINTIRRYLSENDCFKDYKKDSDGRKRGWVCIK